MSIFDQDNTSVVRKQPSQLFWDNGKINRIVTQITEDRLTADKRDWSTRQFNKFTESPIGQLYSKAEQIPVVNFVLPSTEGLTNFVDNRSSAWNKATGALEAVPLLAGAGYKGIKAFKGIKNGLNRTVSTNAVLDNIASNKATSDALNQAVKSNSYKISGWRDWNNPGYEMPTQPTKHIDQFNALQKDRLLTAIQDIRQGMERKGYPKEWYRQFNPALANNPEIAKREIIKSLKRDNTFARGTTLSDTSHDMSVLGLIDNSNNPDNISYNIFDIDSYKKFQLEATPPYNTGGGRMGMEGLKKRIDSGELDGLYQSNNLGAGKGYAIRDDFAKGDFGNLGIVRKKLNLSDNDPNLWIQRNDPSKYYNTNDGYNMENPIGGMIKDNWNPKTISKPIKPTPPRSYPIKQDVKNLTIDDARSNIVLSRNTESIESVISNRVKKLTNSMLNNSRLLTASERFAISKKFDIPFDILKDKRLGDSYFSYNTFDASGLRSANKELSTLKKSISETPFSKVSSPEERVAYQYYLDAKNKSKWEADLKNYHEDKKDYKILSSMYKQNPYNENSRPFAHYISVDKPGEQVADVIKMFDKKAFDKVNYEKGMRNDAGFATRGLSLAGMFGLSTANRDSIFNK